MGLVKRTNSRFWYIQFVIGGETYLKSSRTSNRQLASKIEWGWYNEIIENQEFNIQEEISLAAALDQYLKLKVGTGSYINNSAQVKYIKENMDCSRLLSTLTSTDCERLKQKRASLKDCGLHTLRHTLASKMVKNGFSLYEVQSILGDTSPTTTTRYSHLESASVSKKVADKLFPNKTNVT